MTKYQWIMNRTSRFYLSPAMYRDDDPFVPSSFTAISSLIKQWIITVDYFQSCLLHSLTVSGHKWLCLVRLIKFDIHHCQRAFVWKCYLAFSLFLFASHNSHSDHISFFFSFVPFVLHAKASYLNPRKSVNRSFNASSQWTAILDLLFTLGSTMLGGT